MERRCRKFISFGKIDVEKLVVMTLTSIDCSQDIFKLPHIDRDRY